MLKKQSGHKLWLKWPELGYQRLALQRREEGEVRTERREGLIYSPKAVADPPQSDLKRSFGVASKQDLECPPSFLEASNY